VNVVIGSGTCSLIMLKVPYRRRFYNVKTVPVPTAEQPSFQTQKFNFNIKFFAVSYGTYTGASGMDDNRYRYWYVQNSLVENRVKKSGGTGTGAT